MKDSLIYKQAGKRLPGLGVTEAIVNGPFMASSAAIAAEKRSILPNRVGNRQTMAGIFPGLS
jgi:hypothetical protein